jgi:hypothetical protein
LGQPWYESRTNQGALIGAVGLVIAAAITAVVTARDRAPYPTIEVKDLSPSGEQVLARLALSPAKQLVDSSVFARLRNNDLLWNDSLGVAIRKPVTYEWGASYDDSLESVSISDALFWHWIFGQLHRGFGTALEDRVRFFAVRLDQPTNITITSESLIDSTSVALNPFRDTKYFMQWMRANYGDALDKFPADSLVPAYREANRDLDSVARSLYPLKRRLLTGVFVARVQLEDLAKGLTPWARTPLLDRAVGSVVEGTPTLFVIDRDRGTALFSSAVQLRNVLINGKQVGYVTFNRAGYAVERDKRAYVVMLQYLSSQPAAVLDELQRILESIRIRVRTR